MPEAGACPCGLGVVEDNLLVEGVVRGAQRGIVDGQKGQLRRHDLGDGGGRHSYCARVRDREARGRVGERGRVASHVRR